MKIFEFIKNIFGHGKKASETDPKVSKDLNNAPEKKDSNNNAENSQNLGNIDIHNKDDSDTIKALFEGVKIGENYSIRGSDNLLNERHKDVELPDFSEDDLNISLDVNEFMPEKKDSGQTESKSKGAEKSDSEDKEKASKKEKATEKLEKATDESSDFESEDSIFGPADSKEQESTSEDKQKSSKKVNVNVSNASKVQKENKDTALSANDDSFDDSDDELASFVSDSDEVSLQEDSSDMDINNDEDEFKLDKFEINYNKEDIKIPEFQFKQVFVADHNFMRAVGLTKTMVTVANQDNNLIESLENIHERESEIYDVIKKDTKDALKGLVEIDKKLFGEVNK